MKAHIASLINAITLIILGIWSYFSSDTPSFTALIPVFVGVTLLLTYNGLKKENKAIAHVAVLLTLLLFIALFKPLSGAIARNDTAGLIRVAVMLLTTLLALIYFVKSFIDARRARAAE